MSRTGSLMFIYVLIYFPGIEISVWRGCTTFVKPLQHDYVMV